ncbi:MAG TPA: hypothetical protein VGZ22_01760 [Isosphaeraceae bacterium]|nr:hypothetical protein [Isosphaeraceae bacterium]
MNLHRNLNQLIRLRKIEPEHQSVERWHKTGKLKLRRWDGISYAPTNPYYFSSGPPTEEGAGPGVGGQGMEEGRTLASAGGCQGIDDRRESREEQTVRRDDSRSRDVMSAGFETVEAEAMAVESRTVPPENEAIKTDGSQDAACSSVEAAGLNQDVPDAAWMGLLPVAMWPEEPLDEPLEEAPADSDDDPA